VVYDAVARMWRWHKKTYITGANWQWYHRWCHSRYIAYAWRRLFRAAKFYWTQSCIFSHFLLQNIFYITLL